MNDEEIYEKLEDVKFDLESTKLDIPNFDSDKLCEIVVCYRYLNLHKDLSILAMEELSKRRLNGDSFDFESYIEKSLNSLPEIDFSIPNFSSIISNPIGFKL